MPLLQDLLFGSYLARKQRENEVARAEAMRPDVEFKASVTRATDAARARVATEEANRLEEMRRRRERNRTSEDVADELAVEKQYGGDPLYPRTSRGAIAARNEELATGSKAKSAYNIGYTPFAEGIGAMEGSRKNLETVNDRNRLAGQYGVSYRLGETSADSELARNIAAANVARATSALTPGRTALEQAQNAEATKNAPGEGKLKRTKTAADQYAEDLRAMVNYDRAERGQEAVDTDQSLTELNKILAQSDLRTAKRLFDPNTGSPIDAAIHLGGGRVPQGTAIPGVEYKGPSEEVVTTVDKLTGLPKSEVLRRSGNLTPTLGRRLLAPAASSKSTLPPLGIGRLPDDGDQPPPPAVTSEPKTIEKSRDLSGLSLEDWRKFAYKSYKIQPEKGVFVDKDPIPTLLRTMAKELSTGVDAVTGQPLSPDALREVNNQREAILKLLSR